jgi:signal transduction histidine kinase
MTVPSTIEVAPRPAWRGARVLASLSLAVTLVGCIAARGLSLRAGSPSNPSLPLLASLLVLSVAGFSVAWSRPGNVIGWLLLAGVVLQAVSLVSAAYGEAAYALTGGHWPLRLFAAWLGTWTWVPSVLLPLAVLPAIYPDGRPTSRPLAALTAAGGVAVLATVLRAALGPVDRRDLPPGARLPFTTPGWLAAALTVTAVALLVVSIALQLVTTAVRARRASFPVRQQLLLLLVAVAVVAVLFPLSVPEPLFVALWSLPGVAVAVGVLRYRLLGITVVLRRGLFYLPLTVLVALTVAGVSAAIEQWSPAGRVPQVSAAAAVAFLVVPVAGWLRRGVDRLVLGSRADPLTAVNRATCQEARPDEALASIVAAIADVVDADYVAVESADGRTLAEHGDRPGPTDRVPLSRAGTALGALVISHVPDATGRSMVDALATHVASIVRAQRLTTKLEHARKRAEASRAAERERIRQDMHDGLGPALSGISLSLQAAHGLVATDAHAAQAVLVRARQETDAAVAEVRRVLDELRPVAMDGEDLAAAVRHTARSMGFGTPGRPAFALTCDKFLLPARVEDAAYRIVNEALHNVVRHAHASRCDVALSCADDLLVVRVLDDGQGLAAAATPGVGLGSMQHRALTAGGRLQITSPPAPGCQGTLVEARLPVQVPA